MTRRSHRQLSPREARDLDIEISFLAGLTRRDPAYVEALQLLGDAYSRRGRFHDTLRVDQQVARLRPEDPHVLFNLACSQALTGHFEATYDTLLRALEAGWRDLRRLSREPDLAAFRKHPLYRRLRQRLKTVRTEPA